MGVSGRSHGSLEAGLVTFYRGERVGVEQDTGHLHFAVEVSGNSAREFDFGIEDVFESIHIVAVNNCVDLSAVAPHLDRNAGGIGTLHQVDIAHGRSHRH